MKPTSLTARMFPRTLSLVLALAGAHLAALPGAFGQESPTGPFYPPPGGVTYSGTGTAGQSTGRTNFYTALDPEAYGELYWTFATIENPRHSTQSSTGTMTFAGYNPTNGIATWQSSANMVWATPFGTQSIATRLVLQFQPYTGTHSGPIGSGWLTPTTAGDATIDSLPSAWSVLDIAGQPTDEFQIWFQFQTASGTALLGYYDGSHSYGGSVLTSTSGGFYSTVPEPSTYLLIAFTMGALALTILRNRRPRRRPQSRKTED